MYEVTPITEEEGSFLVDTVFEITPESLGLLQGVQGVASVAKINRYAFVLKVGKLFDFQEVKSAVLAVCNRLSGGL